MDGNIVCFSSRVGVKKEVRREILFSPHGHRENSGGDAFSMIALVCWVGCHQNGLNEK
jgi:hypothetical protein